MVVDYPNSKKARKVFLVLFVGGGGPSQQVPEGLQGEEQQEEGKVQFERRRERENRRVKSGKKKGLKDKDWILKKKEARNSYCAYLMMRSLTKETLLVISSAREGGCPSRFQIHISQKTADILINWSYDEIHPYL